MVFLYIKYHISYSVLVNTTGIAWYRQYHNMYHTTVDCRTMQLVPKYHRVVYVRILYQEIRATLLVHIPR